MSGMGDPGMAGGLLPTLKPGMGIPRIFGCSGRILGQMVTSSAGKLTKDGLQDISTLTFQPLDFNPELLTLNYLTGWLKIVGPKEPDMIGHNFGSIGPTQPV